MFAFLLCFIPLIAAHKSGNSGGGNSNSGDSDNYCVYKVTVSNLRNTDDYDLLDGQEDVYVQVRGYADNNKYDEYETDKIDHDKSSSRISYGETFTFDEEKDDNGDYQRFEFDVYYSSKNELGEVDDIDTDDIDDCSKEYGFELDVSKSGKDQGILFVEVEKSGCCGSDSDSDSKSDSDDSDSQEGIQGVTHGVAVLKEGDNSGVEGFVYFEDMDDEDRTKVTVEITGLDKNKKYGLYFHQFGDLSDDKNMCDSAGDHYDELEGYFDENIESDSNGEIDITFYDDVAMLNGRYSVVGRSVVLHEEDDYDSDRLACGVVGISDEDRSSSSSDDDKSDSDDKDDSKDDSKDDDKKY